MVTETSDTGSGGALLSQVAISPILASATFVIELAVMPILLPSLRGSLGLSIGEVAWVYNIYAIAVAGAVLLGGWLGDRLNPQSVFRAGVLLFAVGAMLCALAPNYGVLLAGRAIQGLGGGIFSPLVPVLLTASARQRPGRILIVWGGITGYVAAALPFLAGEALAVLGWRTLYSMLGLLALTALYLAARWIEEPRDDANERAGRWRIGEGRLTAAYLYVACTYGLVFFTLFQVPQRLVESGSAGVLLSVLWLTFAVISTLLRNMVDGGHAKAMLVAASLALGLGALLLALSEEALLLIFGALAMGVGFALGNAPSTQLVLKLAPPQSRSLAASLDITSARIGGVVVVAMLATATVGMTLVSLLAITAVGVLAALWAA